MDATLPTDAIGAVPLYDDDAAAFTYLEADSAVAGDPCYATSPVEGIDDPAMAHSGTQYLATTISAPAAPSCSSYWNIHLSRPAVALDPAKDNFGSAFVEYAFARDHGAPAWFTLHLLGPDSMGWGIEAGFMLRFDDAYQVVQVPLAALVGDGDQKPIAPTDAITTVLMGGVWAPESHVRIDAIRVRY